MAEEINSDDEERMVLGSNFLALFEGMTGAMKSDEKLEATMSKAEQYSKGWSDLLKKIRSVGQLESESEIEAASAKLEEWMAKNTEEEVLTKFGKAKIDKEVLTMFGTVETVTEVANIFKLLNWAMNDPNKVFDMSARNSGSLTKFFENPLVKIYIKTQPEESFKQLFNMASNHFSQEALKNQLLRSVDSGSAMETTLFVLINLWRYNSYSAKDVFEFLELNKAGIKMLGSPRWNIWVMYIVKIIGGNVAGNYSIELLFTVLRTYYQDDKLYNWFTTDSVKKVFPKLGDEFLTFLENEDTAFSEAVKKDLAKASKWTVKKKGAKLPPKKRRQIDDGT